MDKDKLRDTFEVASVLKIAALCILTFGLYVIFKLYTFSNKVNKAVTAPIPHWFMHTAIVIHLISFISLLIFFSTDGDQALLIFSKLMHAVSSVFHLIWIIKVRNRINNINSVSKGDRLWLNPLLSSFFHVIYMQYKINQSILTADEVNAETQCAINT
tara:strand:+ start:336 stop:809 length:474 start_codon:yes stop_codon:yes gene_type:complete